jgi:prepilin-type N-terminal cleavage/methylation domain-containing protein
VRDVDRATIGRDDVVPGLDGRAGPHLAPSLDLPPNRQYSPLVTREKQSIISWSEPLALTTRSGTGGRRMARAFTLIELLVVIAVIAILASLLLPALAMAKDKGYNSQCQSNLRQMGMALIMYTSEWDEFFSPYDNQIAGSLPSATFWINLIKPFHGGDDGVRLCPATKISPGEQITSGWGRAKVAWGPCWGTNYGSYALNSWVHNGETDGSFSTNYWMSFRKMTNPTVIPLFGDSSWVDAWPGSGDAPPPSYWDGSQSATLPGTGGSSMGRYCVDRHWRGVNIVCADDSVKRARLNELWSKFKWHQTYTPVNVSYYP